MRLSEKVGYNDEVIAEMSAYSDELEQSYFLE